MSCREARAGYLRGSGEVLVRTAFNWGTCDASVWGFEAISWEEPRPHLQGVQLGHIEKSSRLGRKGEWWGVEFGIFIPHSGVC